MASPIEQTVVISFYHAALVSGFAIGYAKLAQWPSKALAEARFDCTRLRDAL